MMAHVDTETDNRPEPPEGIGPHEGRELELMLAGEKPLAMFSDVIPSDYPWPDELFEPYVASGRLIKREHLTESQLEGYKVRYLYYALPDEVWRIERVHELNLMSFGGWCDAAADSCRETGRLLGYQEKDIEAFIYWFEKNLDHED